VDYENRLIPGGFLFGRQNLFRQRILPVPREMRPAVVICEYAFGFSTFWKLLLLRPFFRYRLIGWSHGIKNRDMVHTRKSNHYRLTGFFLKRLDAGIIYSSARMQKLGEMIPAIKSKLFTANNTLDTAAYVRVHDHLQTEDRDALKAQLGISPAFNLVYLGRMRREKRIDIVVDTWKSLRQKYDIGLICIGDGEERDALLQSRIPEGILLPGPIHDIEESGKYLSVADAIINPGYVGLSIVHAFAFGLPMITCRSTEQGPFHSPEIEYLKDGENGFLCDSDPADIAAHVERLILDPDLLARMRESALRTVREEANIERMIDGFRQAIEYVQSVTR
jgi:glycosyltransferase involved in cell wall biosynthesis